jgi:hypothetical protein
MTGIMIVDRYLVQNGVTVHDYLNRARKGRVVQLSQFTASEVDGASLPAHGTSPGVPGAR